MCPGEILLKMRKLRDDYYSPLSLLGRKEISDEILKLEALFKEVMGVEWWHLTGPQCNSIIADFQILGGEG